jgi:hypothetical protein
LKNHNRKGKKEMLPQIHRLRKHLRCSEDFITADEKRDVATDSQIKKTPSVILKIYYRRGAEAQGWEMVYMVLIFLKSLSV